MESFQNLRVQINFDSDEDAIPPFASGNWAHSIDNWLFAH